MARPLHTTTAGIRAKRLRSGLTTAEATVWGGLKAGQCGARFRRQVPIGPWIVDFATFKPRLVVEIDDESHLFKDEGDRTRYIESLGFVILRFDNHEVYSDRVAVLNTIEEWVRHLRQTGHPPE